MWRALGCKGLWVSGSIWRDYDDLVPKTLGRTASFLVFQYTPVSEDICGEEWPK